MKTYPVQVETTGGKSLRRITLKNPLKGNGTSLCTYDCIFFVDGRYDVNTQMYHIQLH